MKKSIVWLASYPKSGNTWVRIFLTNYLANEEAPVAIDRVNGLGLGDAAIKMYRSVAGRDADLTDPVLTTRLRQEVFRAVVANGADVNFVKTHSTRGRIYDADLIPAEVTRAGIYILRNPLDAVLSYARHFDLALADAVEEFCDPANARGADEMSVAQYFGSWSDHVRSWTTSRDMNLCVLRYEDMLDNPRPQFANVLKVMGIPVDEGRLDKAIRFSSFDELSRQESEGGFLERPDHLDRFFGGGRRDVWNDELPQELVDRIIEANGDTMKQVGYIQ